MSRDYFITSGCSYADPTFRHVDPDYTHDYKLWMTLLKEKIGIKDKYWHDIGASGACNRWIFNSVIKKVTDIGPQNVNTIFVSWSGFDRYTIPCSEIKTNLSYELLNWSEITSREPITSMFQIYKSYLVADEDYDKQFTLLKKIRNLDDHDHIDRFLNFKKEVMEQTWKGMGMNFAASAERMFTDEGLDIMFSDNLQYQYALFEYAKAIGANYICAQGVFPLSMWELNRLVQMGLVKRPNLMKGWTNEFTKLMLTNFDNSPRRVSYIIEKNKKHFIGWPYFSHMGGDSWCDLITNNDMIISELDGHPNKEGNELIANSYFKRYKDVFALA